MVKFLIILLLSFSTTNVIISCKHLENDAEITGSQHGCIKNNHFQTNLISFFDQATSLVDGGDADVIYLDTKCGWALSRWFLKIF